MTASGRRIKRRGSGRSSCDEMEIGVGGTAAAAPAGAGGEHSALSSNGAAEEADQASRMHQLLDAQKRAYEVCPLVIPKQSAAACSQFCM